MKHLIIDTNVPLKAANLHPVDEIDHKCSKACLSFIKDLMESEDIIVLDKGREILKEYQKKIDTNVEDNVASLFLSWIFRNLLSEKVVQYQITKIGNNNYAEFPTSPKLQKFDPSDRKFVALAKAAHETPYIYNGSDTDWWVYKEVLEENGIHIVFLCEDYMIDKCKGKKE